jgi:hypothetical protein
MLDQFVTVALASLILGACSTVQAPGTENSGDSPPAQGTVPAHKCDSTNIQQFVGQRRSAELERQMLQVSGASVVRWAPFGTAVTMEFRADRLTAFLDENNRIDRISCS